MNVLQRLWDWLRKAGRNAGRVPASFTQLLGAWLPTPGGWTADRAEHVRHFRLWTYIAVRAICEEIAANPPRVARKLSASAVGLPGRKRLSRAARRKSLAGWSEADELEPVDDEHPLCRLLRNPNGPDTGFTFWYRTALFLELTGNAYWWIAASNGLGKPAELWVLPSHWVWPKRYPNSRELIDAYELRPYGIGISGGGVWEVPAADVIPLQYPSPLTPTDGYSPTAAGGEWIDAAESIDTSRWFSFRQTAQGGMVFELGPQFADPDQATLDRIRAQVQQLYQGEHNAGRPIIVPPGTKVTNVARTPVEMDFINSADQLRDWVLALRRVSKSIAGIDDSMNYASMATSVANFVQRTIRPKLLLIDGIATEKLAHRFGSDLCVYHDEVSVNDPEQVNRDIEVDVAAGAITVNEIRAQRGREPVPGGDELISAGGGSGAAPGLPGQNGQPGPGMEQLLADLGGGRPTNGAPAAKE